MNIFFTSLTKKEAERLSPVKHVPVSPNLTRKRARSLNDLSLLMKQLNVNLICYVYGCVLFCLAEMTLVQWEEKSWIRSCKAPLPAPPSVKGILCTPGLSLKGWQEGWRQCSVKGYFKIWIPLN